MVRRGRPDGAVDGPHAVRRRDVPTRALGDELIVARPRDGAPLLMAPIAALIWQTIDNWTTMAALDGSLAALLPDVSEDDRRAARSQILRTLGNDELIERR